MRIKITSLVRTTPWTKTPNSLLDYWLPKLKDTELRVLLVVVRKTCGWHRDGSTVSMTYRELKARTGRESEAISLALRSLAERRLIHITGAANFPKAKKSARQSEAHT